MAGRRGGQQKSASPKAVKKTKKSSRNKQKGKGWLRRHLGGILLAFALLFFLGGTLLVAGYMVLLSY